MSGDPVRIVTAGGRPVREVARAGDPVHEDATASDPVRIVTRGGDPVIFASATGGGTPAMPDQLLSNPQAAALGTTVSAALGADGVDWPQATSAVIDQYGNIIVLLQNFPGGDHYFVFSNDGGATWADDGTNRALLSRASMQIDAAHDIVHVLWTGSNPSDGVLYRRYSINYDGSNHITGLTALLAGYLIIDNNADEYEHPVLIWCSDAGFGTYGALLAIWSARVGVKFEVRASMRLLNNTADDRVAANWKAPVSASVDTIGNAPQTPYTAIMASAVGGNAGTGADARCGFPAAARKSAGTNALDVYVVYSDATPTYFFKRMRWNAGALDWSTGLTAAITISAMTRAGTDTGSQKVPDLSKLSEDTAHDRMYFAFGNWKSDVAGDTWSLVYFDSADGVSALVDVYSVGGAHSYAVVGDIIYDPTADVCVVSYGKTTTRTAYLKTYRGTTLVQDETLIFSTKPVDIPTLPFSRLAGQLISLFRDSENTPTPPYDGWWVTMDWN